MPHVHPSQTGSSACDKRREGTASSRADELSKNKPSGAEVQMSKPPRDRDATDYARHVEYTRLNPVRARIAVTMEEYPHSSAHPGFALDPCPQGLKPGALQIA